jgi:hypothetical protein
VFGCGPGTTATRGSRRVLSDLVGKRGDAVGEPVRVREMSFPKTRSGGSYEWHQDPEPRFVVTLSGTLEFKVKSGASFIIRPGDPSCSHRIIAAPATTGR